MWTQETEALLLGRLQAGDQSAVEELADRYRSKIFAMAFRHLRNREDAEEVTQDVLYTVYRKVGSFRGDSALSSWIYRITFNAAMSRLRGRRRREQEVEETPAAASDQAQAGADETADWSNLADEQLFRSQFRRRILRAILGLPPIYRAPVMLRDIRGLSTEEASAVLHVKDQTLKSRLHRGRTILRQQLADFAGGISLHQAFAA